LSILNGFKFKYNHQFYFQEDNYPSHGTRNKESQPYKLKSAAYLALLIHPAQSPDLNPIESIWQIIKQRWRGRRWKTVAEFKAAIEREWKCVTQSQTRRKICDALAMQAIN
jgi:transposase